MDQVLDMGDVEGVFAAVSIDLAELLVMDHQEDLLLAKLTQLHALLDEISLSLALSVVAMDVVHDETVAILAPGGLDFTFCFLLWHVLLLKIVLRIYFND